MFTLNRETLSVELSLLSNAVETKGTIPILAFMLIEVSDGNAKLTATDLDVFISTRIAAEGEPWIGCVPFKQLHDFVRLLDKSVESVSFTPTKESRIEVKAPKSKMMLPVAERDNYPNPEQKPETSIKLDGEWLVPALQRVLASASDDGSAMNLSGVYLECKDGLIAAAATDKHRLSFAQIATEVEPFTLFLPRAGVVALTKMDAGELTIDYNESIAWITSGDRVLTARLLVGQFPNWRMVVPKDFRYSTEALTAEVQSAIKRASVTLDRHRSTNSGVAADSIRLRFARETLSIETEESDRGHSEEAVDVKSNLNGESVLIGFEARYILDALSSVGDQVEISLNDQLSQVRIRPLNSESVTHIVMPRRL